MKVATSGRKVLNQITRLFQPNKPRQGRSQNVSGQKKTGSMNIPSYASVAIKTRAGCCAAAEAVDGKRFLQAEAPLLPLKACTSAASACKCRYIRYDDRRDDQRRAEDVGMSGQYFTGADRRTGQRGSPEIRPLIGSAM